MDLQRLVEEAGNFLEKYGYDHSKDTTCRVLPAIVTLASAMLISEAIDRLSATMKETGTVEEEPMDTERRSR